MPMVTRLNDLVPLSPDLRSISATGDKVVKLVTTCGRRQPAHGPHESGQKRQDNVKGRVSELIATLWEAFLTVKPHNESVVHSCTWEKYPAIRKRFPAFAVLQREEQSSKRHRLALSTLEHDVSVAPHILFLDCGAV